MSCPRRISKGLPPGLYDGQFETTHSLPPGGFPSRAQSLWRCLPRNFIFRAHLKENPPVPNSGVAFIWGYGRYVSPDIAIGVEGVKAISRAGNLRKFSSLHERLQFERVALLEWAGLVCRY